MAAGNVRRDEVEENENRKEPGFADFETPQPLQMANDAKIKKWFLGKDQIQDTVKKTQSKDETAGVTYLLLRPQKALRCRLRELLDQTLSQNFMGVPHRASPFNSPAPQTVKDTVPQLQKKPNVE